MNRKTFFSETGTPYSTGAVLSGDMGYFICRSHTTQWQYCVRVLKHRRTVLGRDRWGEGHFKWRTTLQKEAFTFLKFSLIQKPCHITYCQWCNGVSFSKFCCQVTLWLQTGLNFFVFLFLYIERNNSWEPFYLYIYVWLLVYTSTYYF